MTKLWKHQEEAVSLALKHPSYMFAHDMGCIDGEAIVNINWATKRIKLKDLHDLFHATHEPVCARALCDGKCVQHKIRDIICKGVRKTVRIKTENGKELILTPDHEIAMADGSWKPPEVNSRIITGGHVYYTLIDTIISVEDAGEREVYDIVMEDPYRNFLANGIIVHNCGKSFEAIEYINRMDAKMVLIMCPKSVMDVWPKQFWKHSQVKWNYLVLNKGSVKKKAEILSKTIKLYTMTKKRLAVIVNYDSAWRSGLGPDYNRKNRIINKGVILSTVWDIVIADESHRLKSPRSKASWFAYQLAKHKKARRRLCLTGTPMPHGPLDIYAQFRFMDFSIFNKNFTQFRNRYAIIKDMGDFKKIVGYQREEEMNSIFYSRAHRVQKKDVLDLPPVMHEIRTCQLSAAADKLYRTLETEFVAWLEEQGDKITVNNVLTKLLRLGQLTGGFLQLDSGESTIMCNNKIELLEDIFEDLPPDEPIVVFARFTNEIQRIKQLAEKLERSVAELSGQMNQLKDWQHGKFNVLAVQIRAGGVGIDLTRAHYCVYFSTGYSLGDYEQSLARIDRPRQTREGVYYHLLAEKTVDMEVYNSLSRKKKVVEYILQQRLGKEVKECQSKTATA